MLWHRSGEKYQDIVKKKVAGSNVLWPCSDYELMCWVILDLRRLIGLPIWQGNGYSSTALDTNSPLRRTKVPYTLLLCSNDTNWRAGLSFTFSLPIEEILSAPEKQKSLERSPRGIFD